MKNEKKIQIEAAAFRRLIEHLQKNHNVQNIDLMNLAGFCRNCLSKWMKEESIKLKSEIDYENCREEVYGMPYDLWKKKYQKPID
tara:strand:- start:190 stop:444 length:255 start_codon:yes stop_codon:yes gene_type:complete